MPKKLLRELLELLLNAVLLGLILAAIDFLQGLLQWDGIWVARLAAWVVFGLVSLWKSYRIYVGLSRDDTFFYDNDDR